MMSRGRSLWWGAPRVWALALCGLPGCVLLDAGDRARQTDADGDGVSAAEDCDDSDALVGRPGDEVCNGLDDDCDGAVDEGLGPDADGDGFGAAAAEACRADWVAAGADCDDGDAGTHPGALERCDGVDNGCLGAWTPEDESGRVTWTPEGGVAEDWSAAFAAGGEVHIDAPGTLDICAAAVAHPVRLRVETDGAVVLQGHAVGGAGAALQASGGGAVLAAVGNRLDLTVRDLTLQGGLSTFDVPGGGLSVSEADRVWLERVVVRGNLAALDATGGTGVHADGVGRLVVLDSEISGNTGGPDSLGAGVGLVDTDARITRTRIAENTGYELGGGVATDGGRLVLSDVLVEDNEAALFGGGLYVGPDTKAFLYDTALVANAADQGAGAMARGSMSCFSGDPEVGGFFDNVAEGRGAVFALIESGRASFDGCGASGNAVSAPLRDEDAVHPDLWMGDDGAGTTPGQSYSVTGTWLYCDVWSLCQGDVAQ